MSKQTLKQSNEDVCRTCSVEPGTKQMSNQLQLYHLKNYFSKKISILNIEMKMDSQIHEKESDKQLR